MHTPTTCASIIRISYCINLLYSVTKQQQHVYDYISTKPLATGVYNHQVKRLLYSNDDNVVMDLNPAYGDFARNSVKTDEEEYEVVDIQSRQIKTDDITIVRNPAYAETKFN